MYCKDCVDLLADYVDGSLSAEKRQELEKHLSFCPPCITFVRTYKATSRVCRKVLSRRMPDEVGGRLHDFMHHAMKKGKTGA